MAPFAKGNRAAVGHGRPKLAEEFREKARKAVDDHVLTAWIEEVTARPRVVETDEGPVTVNERGEEWLRASELLAAYGYGKPVQALEHGGPDGAAIPVTIVVEPVDPSGDGTDR